MEIGNVRGIGYMVAGEVSESSADLTFTIQGEKRDLKVYYLLSKSSDGNWIVSELSW
jgi:enoyl-[acyl-carrier-protein] reductase (NADH)